MSEENVFEGDLYFNGINPTGGYGLKPMSSAKFARLIKGKPLPEDLVDQADNEADARWAFEKIGQALSKDANARTQRRDLLAAFLQARLAQDQTQDDLEREMLTAWAADLSADLAKAAQGGYQLLSQEGRNDLIAELAQDTLDEYEGEDELTPGRAKILAFLVENGELTPDQQALFRDALIESEEEQERIGSLEGKRNADFPVKAGVDPTRLDQAGWAIVFPARMKKKHQQAIKEALKPLLDLRRSQAQHLYREFEEGQGYRPGERVDQFYKHQKPEITRGPADPDEMPFYVLLVGGPEEIPFKFQYQLDVMRGVGRIDFGDDYDAYAAYARNVVLAEGGDLKLPRHAAFFGAANPGDKATQLSSKYLLAPLAANLKKQEAGDDEPLNDAWEIDDAYIADKATKAQLGQLLGGDLALTPALLMTASHGMEFKKDDPGKQKKYQGALLCQDWGGPGAGRVDEGEFRNYYFAGEDLAPDANLLGMIAFLFACYGGGTPQLDQFAMQAFKKREAIAPEGFVANLPQEMLKHGALAVMGHVERAWGYSFVTASGSPDYGAFVTAMRKLLNGNPIGLATDFSFDMRYADISSNLSATLEELHWSPDYVSDHELAHMWTANNDARSYVVIGDPAVRIPFATSGEKPTARPSLETAIDGILAKLPAVEAKAFTAQATEALPAVDMQVSAAVDFGLGDQISDLAASVKQFTNQLASALGQAASDMMRMEVKTFTTSDLDTLSEPRLRALTYIDFDGDMQVYVPERGEGGVNQELWEIHMQAVHEAQANRAQFFQTMAELATNLLKSLRP
ncbi:MAG: hypothetical protein JXA89_04925 [Anaerolineae bacterium]|nr:hypothetical protein [Anaerolineae bacterium]